MRAAAEGYADVDKVREEIAESRRLFAKHGWPVIDVTRRSIEETAATIIQLYNQRHPPVSAYERGRTNPIFNSCVRQRKPRQSFACRRS